MRKKGLVKVMMLVAAVALVSVGCAKKPKINLAHLREGGNGGGNGMPNTAEVDGFDVNGGFVANDQPGIPGGNGGDATFAGGANGGNGAAGTWGDANAPVNIGGDAAAFLNNAKPWNEKVYFDYNRYEIKASQRPVLDRLADVLSKNNQGIVIEGHCDERGSAEYNRSLSERRALAIRDYLQNMGIDAARMHTLSYGVDRPEIPNARTEQEHSKNRRGQFLLGDRK
ncbi:MAG: OmpA family protein [Victivallales bacterium]|nr:OmpA family protein [Victivallales bacterium]